MGQTRHFRDGGHFQVEDGDVCARLGEIGSQFAVRPRRANRTEKIAQGSDQGLGHPKIALQKDYVERLLHGHPRDLTVVNGGLAAAGSQCANRLQD
jgi:hypothetical protein